MVLSEERKNKREKMQAAFMAKLDQRIQAIREQAQKLKQDDDSAVNLTELHMLVHNLHGTAGTYSLMSLAHAAQSIEATLVDFEHTMPTEQQWTVIDSAIERMSELAAIVQKSGYNMLRAPTYPARNNSHPLIHIVEDEPEQAGELEERLREEGFRTEWFSSPRAFRDRSKSDGDELPAAVVMDLIFPDNKDGATELIAELGVTSESRLPVIVASVRDDLQARLESFRAGACRYLTKPYDISTLIDILDALTGRQPVEPFRVLMVDDDEIMLEAEAGVLTSVGIDVRSLSNPLQVMDALNDFTPDVIVLDVYMPGATGPELAAVIRERDAQLQTPILFLSSEKDLSRQLQSLSLGGDDFLIKPIDPEHFVSAVSSRARRARQNRAIQRRLETTLYEREREHRALNHHALVSVADNRGVITHANEKFCQVSGYSREELIGQNHRIVKSGEHPPEFYQEFWRTIASGKTWLGEICNRRKNGSLYWVDSTITPFLDEQGKPYQYVSIRTDITQRKQAEFALRDSEYKFRTLTANIPGMVYRGKPDWSVEYISNTEGLCGYSADELDWVAIIYPEDRPRVLEQAEALSKTPVNFVQEYRIVHKDGSIHWVSDHKQSLFDSESKFIGVDGVVFDISERKWADIQIEHHKDRLRRGQMYANIGTWEWDIPSGDLYWSERIAPLFGYTEGEVETSYENFLAAVHPDDRQKVTDAVANCIENDLTYDIEHRVVWQDGTVRWLLERGAVARDRDGNPLQMLGVVQDIDYSKQAELALAERERELLEAQRLASLGNWSADLVSGELSWSDEIYHIFGHEPGSFAPSVEAFHSAVHPDDRELVRESEKRAEQTGRHDVIHRIVQPDGNIRHIHELAQMHLDDTGKPLRLTGTLQDVTERIEFEQALVASRLEADRANQAKSEFLSSMSHELRTPMNAIIGFSQLLEYDDELNPDQKDSVLEIRKAGDHLLELINEVLDLAKVESGKINISLEAVEVCSVADECLSLIGPLADEKNIHLSHIGLAGVIARADRTRLKQVLLNLLSNAIKYNHDGGSVRIEVQVTADKMLRLAVTDTGPGIAHDEQEQLFQPFNRLNAENSDIEGTGIGLTLTLRVMELMGGSVGVESEPGAGSTFWIELPPEEQADSDDSNTDDQTESRYAVGEHQHTILYIEDNPANLKLVAQILARRSHINLLTAHTPFLGIELAMARKPELLLLDINLPGLDGYEVLNVLQSESKTRNIPVVAITANAMPRDIKRGKDAGFVDYLTKPLDIKYFNSMLDRLLANGSED